VEGGKVVRLEGPVSTLVLQKITERAKSRQHAGFLQEQTERTKGAVSMLVLQKVTERTKSRQHAGFYRREQREREAVSTRVFEGRQHAGLTEGKEEN
jgi:hypothetical protein